VEAGAPGVVTVPAGGGPSTCAGNPTGVDGVGPLLRKVI